MLGSVLAIMAVSHITYRGYLWKAYLYDYGHIEVSPGVMALFGKPLSSQSAVSDEHLRYRAVP